MRLRNQILYDKPDDGGAAAPDAAALAAAAADKAKADAAAADKTATDKAAADKKTADDAAPAPANPPPKKDWKDDRIGKLTHDLNEARKALAAKETPAPVQKPGETEAAFNARVDEAANAKAAQIAAQNDWNRQTGDVVEKGTKEFPDFNDRVKAITASINVQDPAELAAYNAVVAGAMETGEAHKIIYALGSDPGEFQRLMKLTPVKRAMELSKLALTLTNDKDPSPLPKPITPVGSSGVHYEGITPDDPKRGMKLPKSEWFKQREAQAREKGIQ